MRSSTFLSHRLPSVLLVAAVIGCAEGSDIGPGEGDDDTGADGASSGSGGEGVGAGPSSSASGQGAASTSTSGEGGVAASASSSGSAGSSSSAGGGGGSGSGGGSSSSSSGSGGGGDGTATTLLSVFGGSASSAVVANSKEFVNSTSFATPFTEQTAERIGLAFTGGGTGVLVVRALGTGELRYGIWSGTWFPGFGSPLASVQAGLTISGGPAIAAADDKAHVAYRKDDAKLYYAAIQSGLWSPIDEPVGAGADQSSGPVAPAIATVGADPMLLFVGSDGDLYDRRRASAVWQSVHAHGMAGSVAAISPAVAAPASGPDLLVVFANEGSHQLEFTTLDGGAWSGAAPIPSAVSDDTVSVVALPGSGAAAAWRAPDGSLHAAVYDPADTPPWSEPPGLGAGAIVGTPGLAAGALGARAELFYVDTSYIVYSSRLVNGAWSAPVFTGTSGERVALATGL